MTAESLERPSRGRPRNKSADAAILSAALDSLIAFGAGAMSIEMVAQRAGVTRATIYRRFKNKTALLIAALQALPASRPDSTEIATLDDMIVAWSYAFSIPRMRLLLRRLFGSVDDFPELQRAYRDTMMKPHQARRIKLIEQARRDGVLPKDTDPALFLEILSGAVWNHLAEYPDTSSHDEILTHFTAVLRHLGYRADRKVSAGANKELPE